MKSNSALRCGGAAIALTLALAGCGASDDVPQVGDNPAAANGRSSKDLGVKAQTRSENAPGRSGKKRTTLGE